MGKRALVTGGAGFIGSHLATRLSDAGWTVMVLDNLIEGREENLEFLGANVDLITQDIVDQGWLELFYNQHFDVIFHLAAQANVAASSRNPWCDFQTNVIGTLNVLEFARNEAIPKVIFPSTVSVYRSDADMPISENSPIKASSPYGAAKAAAENYCFAYANSYDIDVTVLRLFNVYGPLMTKYVIHDFVRKLQRDPHRLVILGNGNQVRDYLYIDDAVDAFLLLLERGDSGEAYNVGSGVPVCIRDLACEIISIMDLSDVNVEYTFETWPGDIEAWYADTSKLEDLGFKPQISWEEGLKRTVKFLIDHPAWGKI